MKPINSYKMTREDILREARILNDRFPEYRRGQAVFVYVDTHPEIFGEAARISQFNYGIDCFYRDDQIDAFINQVLEIVNNEFID